MTTPTIKQIAPSHIKSIIEIANMQFGNGFVTELEVLSLIKSAHKYGFVSITNNKISGFVFGAICRDFRDLEPIVVSHYSWFEENFNGKFPIGVIETIGVDSTFKGMGIGKALVIAILNRLNSISKTSLSMVWQHEGGTPLAHILEQCGLKNKQTIANYWEKDSLENKYDCLYCGRPPCHCSVMVYADR